MRRSLPLFLVITAACAGQPGSSLPRTLDDLDGSGGPSSDPWLSEVAAQVAASEYQARPDEAGFRATNPAQGLVARFTAEGVEIGAGTADLEPADTLSLVAWGRADTILAVPPIVPDAGPCVRSGEVDATGSCLRQVTWGRPGFVEWWENLPAGLEQGFTVTASPRGEGALVFELAWTGIAADVEVDGTSAVLLPRMGRPLRYAGLAAWDDAGRDLPAWMEPTEAGLRLVVDDSGAQGTVTVDPTLTTMAWEVESGQSASSFGRTVASAGDVNGDGYDDVIIAAPAYDDGQIDEGRVFVYHGSASGLASVASWSAQGDLDSAYFGVSASSAGDVDGDGFGDVVIGAWGWSSGQANEGRVFVYRGSAAGLSSAPVWSAESDVTDAYFGGSVASAGDVNGDGFGDIVVGADWLTHGEFKEGAAWLYLGSATGLAGPAWIFESDQAEAFLGRSVAGAGDVNGDGYDDVLLGAHGYDDGQPDEGRVLLFYGSASGLARTPAWTGGANQDFAHLGLPVAAAGDVDADGYDDVLIAAAMYDHGEPDEGAVFLLRGSPSGLSGPAWRAESDQAGASFGRAISSAGDMNGDGYGDVIVGAPKYDHGRSNEGRVYVYQGSATGLPLSPSWTADADQTGARLGGAVAWADVNGDGLGDVVIGAYGFSHGEAAEGAALVYRGAP